MLEEQAEVVVAAVAGLLVRVLTTQSLYGTLPCFAAVVSLHCLSHRHRHHLLLQNTLLSLCLPLEFLGLKRKNTSSAFIQFRGF